MENCIIQGNVFLLQFIQWPETLSHFKKMMLWQELKHPTELQMCCEGQSWAGSWRERRLTNKDSGFSSSPPHPLPSPMPGICGCSLWEERLPGRYLMPSSVPLACDGPPEAVRSQRRYYTSPGLCNNWTACWPALGHPKHLPFTALLTVLGCHRVLSLVILYHLP